MNTLEAIASRKSTRAYGPQPVSEEALDAILKAGFAAPVAMARYDSLHITVVQDEDLIRQINDLTAELFFRRTGTRKNTDFGARTLLFVSTAQGDLPPEMAHANVGIVVENMVLAATDLGIDSVILGGAPRAMAPIPELVRSLGAPEGFKPILGIALGYGTTDEPAKTHTITVNRV